MAFRIKSQINIPGLQESPSQSGLPLHLISSATKFQVRCPFSSLTCHAHSCREPLYQLFPLQSIHPLAGAWLDSSCHSALNGGIPWPQCQGVSDHSLCSHLFSFSAWHLLLFCIVFLFLFVYNLFYFGFPPKQTLKQVWIQRVYLDNVARKQGR